MVVMLRARDNRVMLRGRGEKEEKRRKGDGGALLISEEERLSFGDIPLARSNSEL